MTTFGIVWLVVFSLGFALFGWLCVFRTEMLVAMGRKNYDKVNSYPRFIREIVRTDPTSKIILKPWYPTFIRSAGIFIWFWDLLVLYAVIVRHFR